MAATKGKPAAPPVKEKAPESAEGQELSGFEQRLFFKTYSDEEVTARLARVEKKVFGEALSGSVPERLTRIKEALGPQREPDGTITGGGSRPAPQPQVQQTEPRDPSRTDFTEGPEDALEQAKLAVMAAKQEEIRQLLAQGVELWKVRRAREATEKFEQVIRLEPGNAEAHFSLGIIYEASGSFAQALASYKKAYNERPDNREYKAAILEVERKATQKEKLDGQSGELRLLAEDAAAAFKRKEYISALDLYKQLDAKIPPTANIKYNIGTIYLMTSNPEFALEYYRAAKKLKPREEKYITAVAQLESNLKRNQSERKTAEKVAIDAWNKQQPNPGKGKSPAIQPQTQKGQEFLNSFGIIGRTSKDGVVVATVGLASRAAKGGFQQGDIIRALDGTIVKSADDLNDMLSRKQPGQPCTFTVQRGNQMGTIAM